MNLFIGKERGTEEVVTESELINNMGTHTHGSRHVKVKRKTCILE